ncbi:hypothetical protein VTN77DRAFT_5448 [Rasamsonia byssochlamydoides]|uniref:uncharacterized protein n=1 Tax=Rasamsonia byssochlamydoides TaxID=89139 RepID=UPI003743F648
MSCAALPNGLSPAHSFGPDGLSPTVPRFQGDPQRVSRDSRPQPVSVWRAGEKPVRVRASSPLARHSFIANNSSNKPRVDLVLKGT